MAKSKIEWTDSTWSPVTGCTKVSAGCKNCYAEREVETRWSKNPKSVFYGRAFTDVRFHPEALEQPLHWKKPRKIFVCPRGDLFHEDVPDDFLPDVFAVMAAAKRHTFQILTKRQVRMHQVLNDGIFFEAVACSAKNYGIELSPDDWPLKNVWIGVSVEDQATANDRIPLLMQTPAAVRWVSAEPLLGLVNINPHLEFFTGPGDAFGLDWVVVGGESGPKARPMHPDWVRSLRDQCQATDVPFLFKQWGEFHPSAEHDYGEHNCAATPEAIHISGEREYRPLEQFRLIESNGWAGMCRIGKKSAGRLLDGVQHDGYPA